MNEKDTNSSFLCQDESESKKDDGSDEDEIDTKQTLLMLILFSSSSYVRSVLVSQFVLEIVLEIEIVGSGRWI